MSDPIMQLKQFNEINLDDQFFDSLKKDYPGFSAWFNKKATESAYIFENQNNIHGFLYLKLENGAVDDVTPTLPDKRYLKIGTFKVDAHGTRLGERFLKKSFDHAIEHNVNAIYVTAFSQHHGLIQLLTKFGFTKVAEKKNPTGIEGVYLRDMDVKTGNPIKDYPFIHTKSGNSFLLSVYPGYHTRLFPDSILKNENYNLIQDISHTNSIHKVYICGMRGVENLAQGDKLVIYRTSDNKGPAHYRSVATSACVVEEVTNIHNFPNISTFEKYCAPYSVFTKTELQNLYATKRYPNVIKMTYNGAFKTRITRADLINIVGLSSSEYWGFMPVSPTQTQHILQLGKVNANIVVN